MAHAGTMSNEVRLNKGDVITTVEFESKKHSFASVWS
jgi:hypothetical protein